jgi:hypothetical protein
MVRDHRDDVVGADADERVQGADRGLLRGEGGQGLEPGHVDAEQQAPAGERSGPEKVAPAQVDDHFFAPSAFILAARWIALRMRWYVPHRQMFPDMQSSTSLSVGLGQSRRRIAADMIWPDWQ